VCVCVRARVRARVRALWQGERLGRVTNQRHVSQLHGSHLQHEQPSLHELHEAATTVIVPALESALTDLTLGSFLMASSIVFSQPPHVIVEHTSAYV
jgi:hypothetical protein